MSGYGAGAGRTPERDEHGEEDGAVGVEDARHGHVAARLVQIPGAAVVALRAHAELAPVLAHLLPARTPSALFTVHCSLLTHCYASTSSSLERTQRQHAPHRVFEQRGDRIHNHHNARDRRRDQPRRVQACAPNATQRTRRGQCASA